MQGKGLNKKKRAPAARAAVYSVVACRLRTEAVRVFATPLSSLATLRVLRMLPARDLPWAPASAE